SRRIGAKTYVADLGTWQKTENRLSATLTATTHAVLVITARLRLVEPSSNTGTKLARSTHDIINFAQVGRGTEEGRPSILRSSHEGRPYTATILRFVKTKNGRDSLGIRPNIGRLSVVQGRATGELRASWKRVLRPHNRR
ncbi:hypothetical protein Bbelb_385970, partial [Branchiostoma belcheri]